MIPIWFLRHKTIKQLGVTGKNLTEVKQLQATYVSGRLLDNFGHLITVPGFRVPVLSVYV